MKWEKASPELSDFLEITLMDYPCEKKKMFGFPVYFINGNMFTGAHSEGLFLRLSDPDREEILRTYDEVSVFEPLEGRKMKEYVVIPDSVMGNPEVLREWINRSFHYVSVLPQKEKKKDSGKK
jgi:TfoX/Sxy family transcriptional regulator of competence genes